MRWFVLLAAAAVGCSSGGTKLEYVYVDAAAVPCQDAGPAPTDGSPFEQPDGDALPPNEYETRATATVKGDPSAPKALQAQAFCNPRDAIVTGGCFIGDARMQLNGSVPVVADQALNQPASWSCTATNPTADTLGLLAYAVCAH